MHEENGEDDIIDNKGAPKAPLAHIHYAHRSGQDYSQSGRRSACQFFLAKLHTFNALELWT